ncbi:type IVB pilus formation outer membrane protein, R64 PilN family [Edwardsiella tarda]|nr:type IVB pilus formation outer membrane protein, R64 PilN family [Edwardsiella tarda]
MKLKISVLLVSVLLQGCSSFDKKFDFDKQIAETPGVVETSDLKSSPFTVYDIPFLGKPVAYSAEKKRLLEQKITISSFNAMDLDTVMSTVAAQTGVTYRIKETFPGQSKDTVETEFHNVIFNGTVEEFIRYISALYDVSVKLDDNNILNISYYDHYAIKLDFYGENNKFETSIDLSGNEATSSGGVKGKSELKFESSFWDDVDGMAQRYVSSGNYNIIKDASVLAFIGRPSEYRMLNDVLKRHRDDNSRQFVLTYKIFTLDKKKVQKLGAAANVNYLNNGTSLGIDTTLLSSLTGASFGRDFLTPIEGKQGFNISGRIEAIYQLTGKNILQSGTFITRNNVPVPVNITQTQNYISGRTQTTNSLTSVVDTTIETDKVITGSSFILTPRVLSNGSIEVVSAFTKKTLNSVENFESVQLPNVSTTEMFNTSVLKPGTLMIVAKYEGSEKTDERGAMIFGGNYNRENGDNTIAMVVGIDYYRAPVMTK